MTFLLRIKDWQLFLVLMIAFFVTLTIATMSWGNEAPFYVNFISGLIEGGVFFWWLATLAVNLNKKLPKDSGLSLKRFWLAFIFLSVYILSFAVLIAFEALSVIDAFIILHIAALLCSVYVMYFVTRSLRSVEQQRNVKFSIDFFGDWFMVSCFPIGLWFIQPRVNRIFE